MNKLVLPPNESGYNPSLGNGILTQDLAGGMPRQRRTFIGSVHNVPLTWSLSREEMGLMLAFYFENQRNPQPFFMDLILDYTDIREYQLRFVSELQWSKRGNLWQASIQAVAKPFQRNPTDDQEVIDFWQIGMTGEIAEQIELLVNHYLPNALENV